MPAISSISIELGLGSAKLISGLADAGSRVKGSMTSISQSINGLTLGPAAGIAAMVTSFLGLSTSINECLESSIEFEKQMSRLGALTRIQKTSKEFDQLRETARRLGRDTEFTAGQAAGAMSKLAMHGFKVGEINDSIDAILRLASIGGVELPEAARIAGNVLRGFGLEAREMERVTDMMAVALTNSNTTMVELGEAMKYVGPIAHAAGKSIEETMAGIMVLSDRGLAGSMAGTALRGILMKAANRTNEAQAAMKKLGLEFEDAATGKLKSIPDIIQHIDDKLKGLGEADQLELLGNVFEMRAGTGVASLLTAIRESSTALRERERMLKNSKGIAKQMQAELLDNVWGAIKIVQSSWEGFVEVVYSSIQTDLKGAIDNLTEFLNGFRDGVKAATNAVMSAFRLSEKFGPKKTTQTLFGGMQVPATITKSNKADELGLAQAMSKAWFEVGKSIGPTIATFVDKLAPAIQGSVTWFAEMMEGGKVLRQFASTLGTLFVQLPDAVRWFYSLVDRIDRLVPGAGRLRDALGSAMDGLFGSRDKMLETLIFVEWAAQNMGNIWQLAANEAQLAFQEGFIDPMENFGRFMVAWKTYFLDAWGDTIDAWQYMWRGAIQIVIDQFKALGNSIRSFLKDPTKGFEIKLPAVEKVSRAYRSMTAKPPQWNDFQGESGTTNGLRARSKELGEAMGQSFFDYSEKRKKELDFFPDTPGEPVIFGPPEPTSAELMAERRKEREREAMFGEASDKSPKLALKGSKDAVMAELKFLQSINGQGADAKRRAEERQIAETKKSNDLLKGIRELLGDDVGKLENIIPGV